MAASLGRVPLHVFSPQSAMPPCAALKFVFLTQALFCRTQWLVNSWVQGVKKHSFWFQSVLWQTAYLPGYLGEGWAFQYLWPRQGCALVVLLEWLGSNWLEAKKHKTDRAGCRSSAGTHVTLGKWSLPSQKKEKEKNKRKKTTAKSFQLNYSCSFVVRVYLWRKTEMKTWPTGDRY